MKSFSLRLLAIATVVWIAAAGPARAVDAPRKEDRIRFIIHDLVAAQMSADDLGGYLDAVHDYFHGSQDTNIDVPTCTDIGTVTEGGPQPYLYTSNGALDDALAVIDDEDELFAVLDWGLTQGDRVAIFVQDIRWCGAVAPNTIGCAPVPGNVFVVSLTATENVRAMVIGHERGHNAGLSHRTDDSCAMMFPSAAASHGCLNQAEAKAFYNQADISTGDVCECIDVKFMGPNQTWSLNPQGISCDDLSVCTLASTCDTGLCVGTTQIDCSDADPCTDSDCDAITGCFNLPAPDFTPCWDADVCNGFEFCMAGSCTPGIPLICDDGVFCNGPEPCDPISGCGLGTPLDIDDGIVCTIDSCDEQAELIVHAPDDDSCANGLFCDGDELCDPQTGCVSGSAPPLGDGVACTEDSCDEDADLIVHAPDDDSCANGLFCDGDELCDPQTGCVSGSAPPLGDLIACTEDSCDEDADLIVHTPNSELCDDGNVCTAESCDEFAGCSHDPILNCIFLEVPALSNRGLGVLLLLMSALGLTVLARQQRFARASVRW